jgi:transcriptional regulator
MYTPKHYAEPDVDVLHGAIDAHPFATFVVFDGARLVVNHIPFILDRRAGPLGTLRGHVARANPVWRTLPAAVESVVAFQGPHSYVSPSWVASKLDDGKVVPTWNYAVVHASGFAVAVEDKSWLLDHVTCLTDRHESSRPAPWRVSDAPGDYVDKMLGAIVGIELEIRSLDGKWKMSQNRSTHDRESIAGGLEGQSDPDALEVARFMRGPEAPGRGTRAPRR